MSSCSLFFSLPLIFTLVAASISHFLTVTIKFSCYSSKEIDILCFLISDSSSFSVIHANVDLKMKSKESPGCRKARGLEMQNFTPVYMTGWTYVRTIFSEPKFWDA